VVATAEYDFIGYAMLEMRLEAGAHFDSVMGLYYWHDPHPTSSDSTADWRLSSHKNPMINSHRRSAEGKQFPVGLE